MKNLIIKARVAKLVALASPIERTGTKTDGSPTKTRTITHRLYLEPSNSLDVAAKEAAALERTDDKVATFALKQQQTPGYYVMDLDINAIQVLAGSCGCPVAALPLNAPGQTYIGTVQLRNIDDVVIDYRSGDEITITQGHAAVTNHQIHLDEAAKTRLNDALIGYAMRAAERNKVVDLAITNDDEGHTLDSDIAETGEAAKVRFTFRNRKKRESPKQYAQAEANALEKFNAKHGIDVKVS